MGVREMVIESGTMSGSFQCPGPEKFHHRSFWSRLRSMDAQLSLMSPVVLHEFPTGSDHVAGSSLPHSHIEKRMGRPVAFRASRMGG